MEAKTVLKASPRVDPAEPRCAVIVKDTPVSLLSARLKRFNATVLFVS